ncbi:IS21 family transposase [Dyadobacter sp. LHD-138]|uniref:IS21 family transposase n=1 Tax=Dyadobacter sp. LHD-138 TaxID=3071413 RepID=UPI0027E1F092|nr:IS21 family transposase [Dyadobacter sp. LHD-138]MDQ6482516.1 IS21 family transposase [Dyadobacter sp. LHD-138]
MQTLRLIIQMLDRNMSERNIARQFQISRNTIKFYRERLQTSAYTSKQLLDLDDAGLSSIVYQDSPSVQHEVERKQDFREKLGYFLSELKDRGMTRQLLWEDRVAGRYIAQYPDGYRYSQFCHHLNESGKVMQASYHIRHQVAEMIMVDFAGKMMHYFDKVTGEQVSCPVLICVLPFSNYTYVEALPNARLSALIAALNNCLLHFGGVPLSFKTDNMKQVVKKTNRYEPSFTDLIQQWSLHNNITLLAARPGKPKDKAPVEGHVKIAYQRIYAPLRNHIFFNLQELNAAIQVQLEVHNNKNFQGKTYSRWQQFSQHEQHLLQPLPDQPFAVRHSTLAKVQKNYHVTLGEDWHHYSVPFHHIGKQVTIIYDHQTVEIYLEHRRIAVHKRFFNQHGYTTLKEHMPENHRAYHQQKGWDSDYFLRQAHQVGPATVSYIDGVLKGRQFSEQTFNSCRGILRLSSVYGKDRLEAACQRAMNASAFNYKTLANILANNLDKAPQADQTILFQTPEHDNIRGAAAYE